MNPEQAVQQIVEIRRESHRHPPVFETAYSRIRSQPMIQAKISPSVA